MPQMVELRINLPGLDGRFKLVQLSDFHAGPQVATAIISRAIELTLKAEPELVVVTGDFVSYKPKYADIVINELSQVKPPLGIWACLGNHDHWAGKQAVSDKLGTAGVNILDNSGVVIDSGSRRFYLCGIDDIWEGADDIQKALSDRPPDMPVVLLCHNPDFVYQAARNKVDLMLSGHTHGGQVRLPFMGPLVVPSVYGNRFVSGYFKIESTQLYVNRGIGTINPPLRLGVPPEVTAIELAG